MMKILIITSLLLFAPTGLKAQNLKALNHKYGFRSAKFGRPFSSFKNLVEVEKNYYKSTTEDLKLENYILSEVGYSFYKGQLYSITIITKGDINSRGVLSFFQQAYGNGFQSNGYIKKYI